MAAESKTILGGPGQSRWLPNDLEDAIVEGYARRGTDLDDSLAVPLFGLHQSAMVTVWVVP